MPLSNGEEFAGFTIVRLLGSGGMGEVYLAKHPRLPRQNALKILPATVSADADFRERFNREADLASTLYHPHIVGVHDRGEFDDQLWISMDFVDGSDAARLLADRYPTGMPQSEVTAIVTAVASALDYAHKQGLLHRDVKPANIMQTHADTEIDKRILLTDFGIARNLDDISGLTATNTTVGTVAYTAPEQLMGDDVDGRADQYALAATAYHLLTGSPLFQHTNPAVVISRHLNAAPPALSDTRPEFAALDPVIATALAKDPGKRFLRCSDFARAFADHADRLDTRPNAPTVAAPVAPRPVDHSPKRTLQDAGALRRRWQIPIALLIAAILAVIAVLVWRPWKSGELSAHETSTATPSYSPLTTTPPPPPPPVFPATGIDSLVLGEGSVNDTLGTRTLEVKDSSFGTADNSADIDPAACVGVVHGAEQRVYRDTGFLQMRNQSLYPRPYTESEAIDSGGPWNGQQVVVVFPTRDRARSVLIASQDNWRSCASEPVLQKTYEFTIPWELRSIQLRDDVLTVSLVDPSPVPGPNAGACQHALGVRANVLAEAVTCTSNTSDAGNGAELLVLAILDTVRV